MGDLIDVSGFGKLSIAPKKDAKLLVVFGGIPVDEIEFDGVQRKNPVYISSGVYMWKFMDSLKSRLHVFVSVSNDVNGTKAYDALISKLKENGVTPSVQILYLFSGGQGPGVDLLTDRGTDTFSLIFLVDIWMGIGKKSGSRSPDFYTQLVTKHADKITYVYTSGGAANNNARDILVKQLGPQKAISVTGQQGEDGMQTHLRTNTEALRKLPKNGQSYP